MMNLNFNYPNSIFSSDEDVIFDDFDATLFSKRSGCNTDSSSHEDVLDPMPVNPENLIFSLGDNEQEQNKTYITGHTRNFYRGKSFRFAGIWTEGVHYISDDYVVDFVVKDGVLLACKKSNIASSETEPKNFIIDDTGTIVGIDSIYWTFVLAGISGNSLGIKIIDNYWYICKNTNVPEEEQIWINTGVKAKFEFSDLTPEEIELLSDSAKQVAVDFINDVIVQTTGQNTEKLMSQKATTDALNSKVDKITGKGLSTEDYTSTEKTKLNSIEDNAQENIIEGVQLDGTDLEIRNKKVNLPAYPTSLPASDVYSWAKQINKPSYNFSEIEGIVSDSQLPITLATESDITQILNMLE